MATEQQAIRYRRFVAAPPFELVLGLVLGLVALVIYATAGYGRPMLLVWLASALTLTVYFWSISERLPRIARADLVWPAALMLLFSSLYLVGVYQWPVQVSSDEAAIMGTAAQYSEWTGVDIFGVSTYLARPTLLFIPWGNLGRLMGGVDLYHMRLLHGFFGLLVIAAAYALFRQLLPRGWAIFACCVLGLSHSMFMISRLAMRENTAVLLEVLAFVLLLRGLRRDHAFSTYCGGFVAGVGFYVYQPSRVTFPLWLLFLALLALLYRDVMPLRKLARLGAIATAGFVLMAGPIILAEWKATADQVRPQGESLLIYKKARQIQQGWVAAPTELEGVKKNISFGLTTFNNHVVDHAWIYVNWGHGFVDPLTGALIWVGVLAVGFRFVRRRRDENPLALLPLSSFLALWLSFAFVVNKAPNYPRLLVTLPFVAYLVTEAARMLAGVGTRLVARWDPVRASRTTAAVAAGVLVALGAGNLTIAWDFVDEGRVRGDDIGSTWRYVASHPDRDYYIAATDNDQYKYFVWGQSETWLDRLRTFTSDDARVKTAIDPRRVGQFQATRPFAMFMNLELWNTVAVDLDRRYPDGRVRKITPDGRLLVFDVPLS